VKETKARDVEKGKAVQGRFYVGAGITGPFVGDRVPSILNNSIYTLMGRPRSFFLRRPQGFVG
jgi:hypothetical protein